MYRLVFRSMLRYSQWIALKSALACNGWSSKLTHQTRMQILPSLTPSSILSQASSSTPKLSSSATFSTSSPHILRPAIPVHTIRHHLRLVSTTDGLRSLWRGVSSVIIGAGPSHAVHYGVYELIREISGGRKEGWGGVMGTGTYYASFLGTR
jgi:solute carrier family 25 iron transporter 28/37